MQAGFLVLKTDVNNGGDLLVEKALEMPDVDKAALKNIIWVGRFKDVDAAKMHAHNYYCRQLKDIDEGSYTISKGRAIAAIESDKLLQETVYQEPGLSVEDKHDRANWDLYYKRRKQRFSAMILALKVVAIGYLLFILLLTF